MTDRAPDDVPIGVAADLLGVPLHVLQIAVRDGFIPQPVKRRVGLIAAATGYVAALRAAATQPPGTPPKGRPGSETRAVVRTAGEALDRLAALDRAARRAGDETRRQAIRQARARITAARDEALYSIRRGGRA